VQLINATFVLIGLSGYLIGPKLIKRDFDLFFRKSDSIDEPGKLPQFGMQRPKGSHHSVFSCVSHVAVNFYMGPSPVLHITRSHCICLWGLINSH
jgi:hypothetical protein